MKIIQTLTEFWNYLDGKKTNIGAIILFAATFFSEVLVGDWHLAGTWVQPTISTLNWIGMAISGLGLSHKAIKQTA